VARFGTFVADLRTGELRRNGIEVRLQVQPFRILALLLERAGEIVTREELRERLWPSEFVDFDHSLNTAVRKLREALDDSHENPRFVETLARRGYRFIAPVSWDDSTPPRKKNRLLIPIAVAAGVVAIAIALLLGRPRTTVTAPNNIDAVAVLPFANDDEQTQYLSEGLTEILIDNLSRLPNLRVMARTTVFDYKGKRVDPRSAGQALHVSGVVVGHVQRQGNQYAIHVELIDAKDGSQIWGQQFTATPANMPYAQTLISDALSEQLRHGVDRNRRGVAPRRLTGNADAYDAYLWGLHAWNARDLPHALQYFNDALARDSQFAAAYAGLAETYGVMVGYGTIPVADGVPKVTDNANRALAIDPNNVEALITLATTKYRNVWDFAGAEADYRRALAINPNYATGHEWYADYLRSMGRWAEARREIELAYKLDPRSQAINSMMCYSLYYERKYREAIAFANRAAAFDPRLGSTSCTANALMSLGQPAEAMRVLLAHRCGKTENCGDYIPQLPPTDGLFYSSAAKWLELRQSGSMETPVSIAAMYARGGDRDKAFAWLETAYTRRVSLLTNANVDPAFDSLHSDPRWDDLLRRIGLPQVAPPS
jgi:DNA-binding winged helix-turn-helix (wHTH) protein/Tfp pilus assembly protein PilF